MRYVEDEFDLIMITEHMSESLILLKDALNLEMGDIASFAKNVAPHQEEVGKSLAGQINDWLKWERALYDHFNATLWRKIERYGTERMRKEVLDLRKFNEKLTANCVERAGVPLTQLDTEFRDWEPRGVTLRGNKLYQNASRIW